MRTTLVILCLSFASPLLAQVGKNENVLNPNLATKEQLLKLPHMTEGIVETITYCRPFLGMDKLDSILAKSLDRKQREKLYVQMFIPINLNTAKKEEIQLVPGMGKKMLHEFEEYRPYKKIAVFRREMGKYVDDAEVARFEQYVFVPLDLNQATNEEFKTIPGVGKKMVREFLEYRPYLSIEQFRREIGKYVDKSEVSRLERYVFVTEEKKLEKPAKPKQPKAPKGADLKP